MFICRYAEGVYDQRRVENLCSNLTHTQSCCYYAKLVASSHVCNFEARVIRHRCLE